MNSSAIVLFLQVVAFVGVPAALLALTIVLRWRERMHLLDIVRSTAEQGHPLPADVIGTLRRGRPLPSPERDYRRGVLLVAIAAAIVLLGFCAYVMADATSEGDAIPVGVGVGALCAIPGCLGAALILLSRPGRTARVD